MASSTNATAEHQPTMWRRLAALILAFQGLNTILYAGLLPPPISDAGVDIPLLGHLPFVWLAAGTLDISAAVGVARRQTWGRALGIVASVVSILGSLTLVSSPIAAIAGLVLPGLVLFALVRRWQPRNAVVTRTAT